MKQVLIDTEIFIDHLTTNKKESSLMKLLGRYNCFTTVINAMEIYEKVGRQNKRYADMVLYPLKVLGIPSRYAEKVIDIMELSKIKKNKSLRDILIVMMAVQNDLILATFDIKKYSDFVNLKLLKINKG